MDKQSDPAPRPVEEGASQRLLAFVHVPKTGGTSLEGVFLENRRPMFNIRHPDQARAFLELPAAEREAMSAVFGHMPFGIDRLVDRPVTYITFLRHPVERVLSAYSHNLRHPEEPGAEDIRRQGIAWTAQPANFMCRMLADYDLADTVDEQGQYWWYRSPAFLSRSYLDQAKANLERCDFIGLTETYDEDIQILSDLRDHGLYVPPTVPRAKVGDNRIRQADLTAEQIAAIQAGNRLDLELYEHALRLREAWGGPLRPSADSNPRRRTRPSAAPTQAPAASTSAARPPAPRRKSLLARLKGLFSPPPSPWVEAELDWKRLPSQEPAGPLPQAFAMPQTLYAYGAATGLLKAADCVLRLQAKAQAGGVGLMLTSADGGVELSAEQVVRPADGKVDLCFRITPEIAPAILVVRNYEGSDTEVLITGAQYGPADPARL